MVAVHRVVTADDSHDTADSDFSATGVDLFGELKSGERTGITSVGEQVNEHL